MPRNTTDPNRYPDYYHTIWQLTAQNSGHVVPCKDKKTATTMRLELYSLRTAYSHAGWNLYSRIKHSQIVLRSNDLGGVDLILRDANDSAIAKAALESLRGLTLDDPRTGKPTVIHPDDLPTEWEDVNTAEPPDDLPDTFLPGEIKPGGSVF